MRTREFPITGMTCSSCEETVSAALCDLPGVDTAAANRRTGRVTVTGTRLPGDARVAEALASTPYGLGARPWLSRDHLVWRDLAIAVGIVGVLGIAAWGFGIGERVQVLTGAAQTGSGLVALGLGVAASVSTCMALVGGLVMSLASQTPTDASVGRRLAPHLAFNAGRVVGFAVLGAIVGLVGRSLAPTGPLLAALVLAAAAVMLLVGVRLTETSPRLAAWQLSLPGRWGGWARNRENARSGPWRTALIGAATFFLPCGFTQAVQLYALSTGSAVAGGTIMALFAVGTTPGLVAAGMAASTASRGSGRALRGIGVAVIAFAVITASGAVNLLAPGLARGTVVATERTSNVVDSAGMQLMSTDIVGSGYSPQVSVVYAGEPVRWTIDPAARGCQNVIDGGSLGLGQIDAWDEVTVEFTLEEAGTYPISCAMGMFDATIVAIDRPAD